MRWRHDVGSVLAADLALAATIMLAVAAIAAGFGAAAGRIQDHREAARHAAVVAARSGDLGAATVAAARRSPEGVVGIRLESDMVIVTVSSTIEVAHPASRRITLEVSGTATVPIAPYRSGRG